MPDEEFANRINALLGSAYNEVMRDWERRAIDGEGKGEPLGILQAHKLQGFIVVPDESTHVPPSRRQRLRWRVGVYHERVRDAWHVLRGKAEVSYGDDYD